MFNQFYHKFDFKMGEFSWTVIVIGIFKLRYSRHQ